MELAVQDPLITLGGLRELLAKKMFWRQHNCNVSHEGSNKDTQFRVPSAAFWVDGKLRAIAKSGAHSRTIRIVFPTLTSQDERSSLPHSTNSYRRHMQSHIVLPLPQNRCPFLFEMQMRTGSFQEHGRRQLNIFCNIPPFSAPTKGGALFLLLPNCTKILAKLAGVGRCGAQTETILLFHVITAPCLWTLSHLINAGSWWQTC